MENRFGLKDFVLFALLVVLIIVQLLQMKQRDLQQERIEAINHNIESQSAQIATLMRSVNALGSAPAPIAPTTSPSAAATVGSGAFPDPFAYIKAARKMPGYARGDWLVDSFRAKLARVTPFGSAADAYGAIIRAKVQEACAYRDPFTLERVPMLAQSWNVSEDGLTVRVQLRHGVTFSDGQPLTADDVVWSFNWCMNPKVDAARMRAYLSKVAKVEKAGDYEVVWTFKEPYFNCLELALGVAVMPKHFYEKYTPDQFNQTPGLLMGSGPYKLADPAGWKPGKPIELMRNEFYWGEAGPWDKLVWHEVESDAVAMTMFKNGEVDRFDAQPEQYRILLADPQVTGATQHFEIESPIAGYYFIGWNQRKNDKPSIWADKRVRQAMTMLTNRQAICDQILLGYASVASGPFNPLGEQCDKSIQPWPYDPDRAKSLLREAGFTIDGQGLILDPSGQPLRFKLTYGAKNETIERMALMLKDAYARIGVVMDPDPVDWPILQKKLGSRDFDAIMLGWTSVVETDLYQIFDSRQIKDQGDDFISYANPELDRLIEQARSTVDPAQRMPLWQKCHQILHEDQPYTFLLRRKALVFYDKRIHNLQLSKLGLNYVGSDDMPCPWFVPVAEQKWAK